MMLGSIVQSIRAELCNISRSIEFVGSEKAKKEKRAARALYMSWGHFKWPSTAF